MNFLSDKKILTRILIIVLCIALIGETVALVMTKTATTPTISGNYQPSITLDATGVVKTLSPQINGIINDATDNLLEGKFDISDIKGSVRKLIYSDTIVSTVMSLAYPLLYNTLDNLGLMDFAENVSLYPTGPQAGSLLKDKGYTACNKSGKRQDLGLVLEEAGSDWNYMNSKVKLSEVDSDEEAVSLWYTIDWGVKDSETFYKAMNDMGEILRGALEVGMQGKEITVNINVVDYLLNIDAVNVNLDAAQIFNSSEKAGYECGVIYLLNMLGLDSGDYPTSEEFNAYTSIGDIWKAIFEPILKAVDKALDNPADVLMDMLVNFAAALDSGELIKAVRTIKMDATYNKLAATVMGFEDGEVFNIGYAIIEIIESLGLKLSGSFNELLDSLLSIVPGAENTNLPDMDVNALIACAQPSTLSNGNTHYDADTNKTLDFMIDYIVNENIISTVLDLTPLKGTAEGTELIAEFAKGKESIANIAKTLATLILKELNK